MFLSVLAVLSFASSSYAGIGPVTNLHIVNKDIAPDGFTRSTVLAGATSASASFPGPPITAIKGSHYRINVIDELTDDTMLKSTSLHWHGLFQATTSWADGVSGVTQCPIAPGNAFLYDFKAPDQAGTYWYHSHYSTQYCDGLRGAFVIYDPLDPHRNLYNVDNDSTILTVGDWYHTPAKSAGLKPVPDATLINGLGRYSGGPASPLAIINVMPHVKYRFRLVGIGCGDANYQFSIDGHNMTIIEIDGVNHHPLTVDQIQVFAGQRYSFVLEANQPIGNYWIRANPSFGTAGFAGGINSAILHYFGAPNADPITNSTASNPLNESQLVPLDNPGYLGSAPADVALNLNIAFNFTSLKFTMNGVSFIPPTVPVLLQMLSGANTPASLLPAGDIFMLPPNKIIELSIPGGTTGAPHPFHLHGHTFDVIRSAGSSNYNYVNPPRRDVVNTGISTNDNVTIRFKTDNAGPWIFHCHIDWHLEVGLAIVFAEDAPAIDNSTQPTSWDSLCPTYNALPASDL